jgi:hypothetical protein
LIVLTGTLFSLGLFKAVTSYDWGAYLRNSIVEADVNKNGKPDLLVASHCVVASVEGAGAGRLAFFWAMAMEPFRPL